MISLPISRSTICQLLKQPYDPFQICSAQIRLLVLAINGQKENLIIRLDPVVDDTHTAGLTPGAGAPANLAHTAGATDDRPGVGRFDQMALQSPVILVLQITGKQLREYACLYEDHAAWYAIGAR